MNQVILALVIVAICLVQCQSQATSQNSHVNYDLHTDIFYLDDNQVNEAYKRKNFNNNARITLAGQNNDMTGRKVSPSLYPFAVAQKSVVSFGSNLDRWDVKQNKFGHQFFGLYQGNKSPFVVNALRASLLNNLIVDLSTDLNELDAEYEKFHLVNDDKMHEVELGVIDTLRRQDELILQYQKDSDSSSADALVIIVTRQFVITVNVGQNKAVAIDALGVKTISGATLDSRDVFGNKKSKKNGYQSRILVDMIPRVQKDESDEDDDSDYELQFLVVEAGSVAKYISNDEVSKIVLKEVKTLGKDKTKEQDIYSKCVSSITSMVTSKVGLFNKVGSSDYTVILIGLTTDYSSVH